MVSRNNWLLAGVRCVALTILLALLGLVASLQAQATSGLETLEPGKLSVAFTGDMPLAYLQDDHLVGTDGEMLSRIAGSLGLAVVPQQMDWASAIESTSSGRVDVMIGAVGWTEARSKVMLLSDPLYYFRVFLAQKTATSYRTFDDLVGKKVGTVTGISLVPELQSVPGIGEVKLYDTSEGVLRDLVAGRVDIAILDPPLVELAIREHPEWDLHQLALQPDPVFPIMSNTYYATIAIRMEGVALASAINGEIAKFWATCENQQIMASYGVTNPGLFVPPAVNPRVGIDRSADWASPTLNPACDANAVATPAT